MNKIPRELAIGILVIIIFNIIYIILLFSYYLYKFHRHYKEFPRQSEYPEIIFTAFVNGLLQANPILFVIGGLIAIIYRCIISL